MAPAVIDACTLACIDDLCGPFNVDAVVTVTLTVKLSAVAFPGRSGHNDRTKSYSQVLYAEEKPEGKLSV